MESCKKDKLNLLTESFASGRNVKGLLESLGVGGKGMGDAVSLPYRSRENFNR